MWRNRREADLFPTRRPFIMSWQFWAGVVCAFFGLAVVVVIAG